MNKQHSMQLEEVKKLSAVSPKPKPLQHLVSEADQGIMKALKGVTRDNVDAESCDQNNMLMQRLD